MSSNASWSCLKAYSIHLANPDLIQTAKITHSKMHCKFYYFKTLKKYSLVVVRSLFHAYGQFRYKNGLKSLLDSVQWKTKLQNHVKVQIQNPLEIFSGSGWKPISCLWSIHIGTWTVNFALYNLVKNKFTKSCESSYQLQCFLVVFGSLFHSLGQSRLDPNSTSNLFKDWPEVLLL